MIGFAACSKPQFSGEWVKLGELCDICSGGTPKRSTSKYWNEGSIPWVKISDISNKYVYSTEERITEEGLKCSSAKMLAPGTLLYSIFASIGAVGILKIPATTNQAIAGLSIKTDKIDRDYLYHFLKSREALAKSSGRGAAQNNINLTILRGMEVPVPPIDEQKSIAGKLEEVTAQIEKAKSFHDQLNSLVKSRFVEMFGDPNLIQQSETWERIGNLCEVVGGATPKTSVDEYWNGGLPWITPAEIKEGDKFLYDTQRKLSEAGVRSTSMSRMPIGTVILSSRAPIGKVAIAGIEMYCNQGFKNLICGPEVLPGYLYELLRANSEYLNSLGRGATFKELSKKTVDNIKIPVPALERQGEFVDFASKVDKLRFRCLETLRLYLTTVHFVAQQIVVMAGLFWGQRNIKPRCFNATWIRMEDGQHG